jgi:precorrin-2 dehydrogenase/sirohydrochlorin ferrochelatase
MNRHYPAFLDLAGKNVLLVGGGMVALQKAIALGEAGARITAVALQAHPDLRNVPGVVRVFKRASRAADVGRGPKAPWLVVAATDDEKANAAVAKACAKARVWVNVVDRPALCSFIVPAVARQGLVTFAVSTGGASPALAKFLAGRLGKAFGPEVAALAEALARLRPLLRQVPMEQRKVLLEAALSRAAESGLRPEDVGRMEEELLTSLRGETDGKP